MPHIRSMLESLIKSGEFPRVREHITTREFISTKRGLRVKECFVSTKFGPLMIFFKRWFAYNKITQGEMHEYQEKAIA